jgi:DNA-binding protein Fis
MREFWNNKQHPKTYEANARNQTLTLGDHAPTTGGVVKHIRPAEIHTPDNPPPGTIPHKDKDILIDQVMDIKMLKHLLKGASDKSTINIIYSPSSTVINNNGSGAVEMLLCILDGLPGRKMCQLKDMVCEVVLERFEGNQAMSARYLGVSRRTLERFVERREVG